MVVRLLPTAFGNECSELVGASCGSDLHVSSSTTSLFALTRSVGLASCHPPECGPKGYRARHQSGNRNRILVNSGARLRAGNLRLSPAPNDVNRGRDSCPRFLHGAPFVSGVAPSIGSRP